MALYDPVYNELFPLMLMEALVQKVDILNGSSNNTILMGTEAFMGNYKQSSFFGRYTDLIERRDITSDAATTDKRVSLKEDVDVVIDFKSRAFETYENLRRTGREIGAYIEMTTNQLAEEFVKRHVNLAMSAAVQAAVNASVFHSALNTTTTDFTHLLKGQELFDDKYDEVAAYVMNVNAWFDLRRNITSNYKFDTVGGVQIASGMTETMGKPVIVSNIPALSWDSDAMGNFKNRIVALKPGAIQITERDGRISRVDEVTDQENIGVRLATDGSCRMGLLGYSWDIANGGASPSDAALQLGTNWDANIDSTLSGIAVVDAERA